MNFDKLLLATLSQDAFFLLNKNLVKKIGVIPAVTLSLLIDKYKYYLSQKTLDKNGGFFLKSRDEKKNFVESELSLGRIARRSAFAVLQKLDLIQIKKIGHPARYYYYINHEGILALISEVEPNLTSEVEPNLTSEVEPNLTYNKNREQKQRIKTNRENSQISILSENGKMMQELKSPLPIETNIDYYSIKKRLQLINQNLGFSYNESNRANQMVDKAIKDFSGFEDYLKITLERLDVLSLRKLDQFTCLRNPITIQSLININCQLMAKIEGEFKRVQNKNISNEGF